MIAGADRRRDYVRLHMQWALAGAFMLGVGSVMLLLAPIPWVAGGGTAAFVLRFPAIAIHFLGWMFLLASLIAVSAMPRFGEVRRNTGRMKAAWGLSVFGTVVAVVSLAIQVAGSFGGPAYLLAGLSSIGYFQAATGLWRHLRARLRPTAGTVGPGLREVPGRGPEAPSPGPSPSRRPTRRGRPPC